MNLRDLGAPPADPAAPAATSAAGPSPSGLASSGSASSGSASSDSSLSGPSSPSPSLAGATLTRALQWVLRQHGSERTALSLFDGLPHADAVTPLLASRALTEAGFKTRIVRRRLDAIHAGLLPAILLLRDGRACTLVRRPAPGRYEIAGPDDDVVRSVGAAEFAGDYGGHCLLIKPPARVDRRGAAASGRGGSGGSIGAGGESAAGASAQGWLWRTLWRYRGYYRDAAAASVLINVLSIATGLFAMHVYDRVIPHKAYATLWSLAVGTIVAMLFEAFARHLRAYLLDLAGKKADVVLAAALFRHTLGLRLDHRPDSSGTLAHQLREFETIREFGTSASLAVLADVPFVFLFVAMVFLVGGDLGWVPLLTIPLVAVAAIAVQWPLRRLMSRNLHESAQLNGVMIESIDGIETLRAAGASGYMQRRYEDFSASTAMTGVRVRTLSNWVANFVQWVQQAEMVALLIWGSYLVHDGRLSPGALVGAVMFANRAVAPLGQFTALAARYQGARAALKALNYLMNLPVERDPQKSYLSRPRLAGAIALHRVGFAYPGQQQHGAAAAVSKLDLQIRPGERVAIVGRIGSGKSTALRLIGGLFPPGEGQVQLDGIDLRQIDPADLRAHVGFVGQDVRLFHGTLRENVMLERPHASWDAYLSAARLTGLDRLAAAHPLGHDLPIGEGGAGLSGGQRQLVALARALVTRPRILLLDEPTSAMDLQTEDQFVRQLAGIVQGRTVVIVTHRPSLLPLVDRIVVFDQGRIVADGPKDQVLEWLAGAPTTAATATPPASQRRASAAQPT
ncbi:MAG: type I secretion system permease/ATPase [Lautropia sp.]